MSSKSGHGLLAAYSQQNWNGIYVSTMHADRFSKKALSFLILVGKCKNVVLISLKTRSIFRDGQMKEKTNIRFGIRTDDEDHNKIQQTQTSNYYFCRCNKQDEL